MRHFINTQEYSRGQLEAILDRALEYKIGRTPPVLGGKSVGLLFFNPSLRTRVSFEVGIRQLGGNPVTIAGTEEGVVKIYYGIPEKGLAGEPGGKITLDIREGTVGTHVFHADFNKDGKADLILRSNNVNEQRDFVEVRLSK